MARRKGEVITLQCSQCHWGTELALAASESSQVVTCAHCGAAIYWHRCESCGLCYAGEAAPRCPICEDSSLDEVGVD